jgi:hypothetical protein
MRRAEYLARASCRLRTLAAASVGSPGTRLVELEPARGHGWDLVAAGSGGARPALSDTVVDFLIQDTS